jgi:hypothetical protein
MKFLPILATLKGLFHRERVVRGPRDLAVEARLLNMPATFRLPGYRPPRLDAADAAADAAAADAAPEA